LKFCIRNHGGVRAAVAATGLVGHSSDCGGNGVGTGIAATAALACGNGSVGAVIVVAESAQGLLWRLRHSDCGDVIGWRSDCGDGGVHAAVVPTGLVGHSGDCGGDGVGAGIAAAAALAWGNGGIGAVIVVTALAQGLRWRRRCMDTFSHQIPKNYSSVV
jgi:hypothetical protein